MSNRKNSLEGKSPFLMAARHFAGADGAGQDIAARLAMVAGDLTLILDAGGRVIDVAADPRVFPEAAAWVGRDWLDTVTIESRPKIMEMLAGARKGVTQHWRQVNLLSGEGDMAVRFVTVPLGKDAGGAESGAACVAIGRDMRDEAKLQQRLLQAQQSLERDYIRLRQLEARYRLLFEQTAEPVLIVDADTFRIREANLAAHQLFHSRPGALQGGKLTALFAHAARDPVIAFLGSAMVSQGCQPLEATLAHRADKVALAASGFRERGGQFLLVRLSTADGPARAEDGAIGHVIEAMPDAFVLTDEGMVIREANAAFVELVSAASADQLRGQPLGDYLGRPGIDLDLIDGQLAKHDSARNVMTVVGARDGFEGEPVELSAVRTGSEPVHYGFVIRPVGRRLRDLPATSDSPRSVEQLTELVGRMSLRDIVRESTDLIERLCIEAALEYTSNNRASAAEILGLSRQSLYSKLHRYGLGNMADAED
jgi:transcriptional regulator PpsR